MSKVPTGAEIRQLVESITKHHVNIAAEFAAIDRVHESAAARRSSVGAHSDTRDKIKQAPNSYYDDAQRNPALAKLLRKMQMQAYK